MTRLLILLSLLAACEVRIDNDGTDSGNAMDVDLGVSGSDGLNRSRADEITAAWIGLESVRPELCDEPDDDDTGPQWLPRAAIDLLSGESLGLERLPNGDYCGVEVKLGRLDDGSSPLGDDRTLLLDGTTVGGTSFAIRMSDEIEFDVRDATRAISGRAETIGALLEFDLSRWIADVDLDSLPPTDGTVLIDQDHNSDLLESLASAVRDSATIYVDDDGDLEPDR